MTMNNRYNIRTYRRYAPFYDALFGKVLHPGRKTAIAKLNGKLGAQILEVGIGTGISLPFYPRGVTVTGIDLSAEMLKKAEKKKQLCKRINVKLLEMDAQDLKFPDDCFDKVVVMYVASVVPDAERMMNEIKRVCKDGGDVVIVNHFSSKKTFLLRLEKMFQPLQKYIGFRADFPLDRFVNLCDIKTVSIEAINIMGYWTLLHFKNTIRT